MNKLLIGTNNENTATYVFDDDSIISASGELAVSLSCAELSEDQMVFTVSYERFDESALVDLNNQELYDSTSNLLNSAATSDLAGISFGTKAYYYYDNSLVAEMFVKSVTRTAQYAYEIVLTSIVGILDSTTFYGYYFNDMQFSTAVEIIFKSDGLRRTTNSIEAQYYPRITYDNNLQNSTVRGWMDICTKREALQQLLFATGAHLEKNALGNPYMAYLYQSEPAAILDADIYDVGSVSAPERVSSISVTEHNFQLVSTLVDVFDNSDSVESLNNAVVTFNNAPILPSSLVVTGSITVATGVNAAGVENSQFVNCNAAVCSGKGKIQAYSYAHGKSVVTKAVAGVSNGKELTATDATMVSYMNSGAVADRLAEYYAHTAEINNAIAYSGQRCPGMYSFTNPFREPSIGYMSKMSIKVSNVLKAACEIILGYAPASHGNTFSNSVLLTASSGTFTVPASVFQKATPRIRIVLVGGGQGGRRGRNGQHGGIPSYFDGIGQRGAASGGAGGAGGTGGDGGKILQYTIENPSAQYTYSMGAGGAGGTVDLQPGEDGGDTIFTDSINTYTSANGEINPLGITDNFHGGVYGLPGNDGKPGGKGGSFVIRGDESAKYVAYVPPTSITGDGTDVGVQGAPNAPGGSQAYWFHGGAAGGPAINCLPISQTPNVNGGDFHTQVNARDPRYTDCYAGDGGKGCAAGISSDQSTGYGTGGVGGNGGGGGGAAATYWNGVTSVVPTIIPHVGGIGTWGNSGAGGPGGDGRPGCIIVYY